MKHTAAHSRAAVSRRGQARRLSQLCGLWPLAAIAALFALGVAPSALPATATGAVVSNGTVALGVTALGDLNYNCTGAGDTSCPNDANNPSGKIWGVRYLPLGHDAISPGCACEGWGVADEGSGLTGYANESSGNAHVTVDGFVASASSAVSTVTISDPAIPNYQLQVVHDYHPSGATSALYEATVTIRNTGTTGVTNLLYRRAMDWDVEPTAFQEWVTIQNPGNSPQLKFDSDNGFATSNPLAGPSNLDSHFVCGTGYTGVCTFTDLGSGGVYPTVMTPDDHGALFDFQFGALAPGVSKSFRIFYGAAASESGILTALGSVGAEVYSIGEPNCPESADGDSTCSGLPAHAGVEQGLPNAFGFGFVTTAADLSITKADAPDPVVAGSTLTYTLTVHNAGPNTAAAVNVTDALPSGVTFVSASASTGTCSGTSTVTCDLGSVANGATATITIVVTPLAAGTLTNTATVQSTSEDANRADNTSTATTTVTTASLPPDCSTVVAIPPTLWPPDHKFGLVTLVGGSDPNGDSLTLTVTGVTQNEPAGKDGPDWQFAAEPDQVWLRAERLGAGDGRIYTISFTASNSLGAACSGTAFVTVLHDLGN
jgi:uncharacterized repeat protein (TIGR01451 family)